MANEGLLEFCHQVDIGDYYINYLKVGSGPVPIFCFPGLLGNLRICSAEFIQKIGKECGQTHTFYTWDTPGYFGSRPPLRKDGDISFEADVNLCAAFLEKLGHSKCILMGHSAGGQTAIQFAIKYPDVVEKLIVLATWDVFDNDHLPAHRRLRDLSTANAEWLANRIKVHDLSYEEYEKSWHSWLDMVEREHFNQDKELWVQKFKKINCPTLIVAGSDDPIGPVAQSQHLHQHIENSRLEIIEGAAHMMQVTHLDEVFQHFVGFLD